MALAAAAYLRYAEAKFLILCCAVLLRSCLTTAAAPDDAAAGHAAGQLEQYVSQTFVIPYSAQDSSKNRILKNLGRDRCNNFLPSI